MHSVRKNSSSVLLLYRRSTHSRDFCDFSGFLFGAPRFFNSFVFQYLWQNHRGFAQAAESGGSFESYLRSQII